MAQISLAPQRATSPVLSPRHAFLRSLSSAGLVGGGMLFSLSLFPSLLPRSPVAQGVVSGVTTMIGYGLAVGVHRLWDHLELPRTRGGVRRITTGVVLGAVGLLLLSATWQHVGWQNEVRTLFGMPPIGVAQWPATVVVTVFVAGVILLVARSLRRLWGVVTDWLERWLPHRLSRVLGTAVLAVVLATLWSGVLVNGFFVAANAFSAPRDRATSAGEVRPASPLRSGGPGSLVGWDSLGRQGRSFVAAGPTVDDLNDFHGGGAVEPIRVYAGLESADTPQARADLVLAELQRTGAFDRAVLVVATTTGTGQLDPNGVDPVEYVHNGDTAIVGVQYSYLPSWISLLADQDVVRDEARVVFDTIHAHWATLPEAERPGIYLYGLSLGSFGAEAILTSINLLNEPIDGALLTGPPFVNELRNRFVDQRQPGSPPWRPVYEDGRTVRFMTRHVGVDGGDATWGGTRILYLQHASDPVVFFSPDLAYAQPDWLRPGQRGPDVAGSFVWVPIVTMWQVAADLPAATRVPEGFGHLYSAEEQAAAWAAVTRAADWTDAHTAALADALRDDSSP